MEYYKNLDQIKIVSLDNCNKIIIQGFCVSKDRHIPNLQLKINKNHCIDDYLRMNREDVISRFHWDYDSVECGFRFVNDINETITSIALFADSEEIVSLSGKDIEKVTTEDSLEVSIDGILMDHGIRTITGFATSYKDEVISFGILNGKNEPIEYTYRQSKREDLITLKIVKEDNLFSGFIISFMDDPKEKYSLLVQTNSCKKVLPIIIKSSKTAMNKKLSALSKKLNKKSIKNGLKYLGKYGVKGFINRLRLVTSSAIQYNQWFQAHRASENQLEEERNTTFDFMPKISILVPTFNTPISFLEEMIHSVMNQSYENWELCIADGSYESNPARKKIQKFAEEDSRIKVCYLDKNYGISGNTNKALELATGDFIGLFDHDDILELDALFEVVKVLQDKQVEIVYTDEDKYDTKNKGYVDPNFKPDYNVDLFRSHNYITHFFVAKASLMKDVGGFDSEYDGAQDYDLMFKCIEKAKSVYHIPKILYHWRMSSGSTAENPESKMYAYEAGRKAIAAHYKRTNVDAVVECMPKPFFGMYKTTYSIAKNPLISIIIPNMEHKEILETCIQSLYEKNTYKNFEVIIVENNSKSQEIFDYYNELEMKHDNIKVVKWENEFNYAAINNFGVKYAKGDFYLFLNNDTEIISPDALAEMVGCGLREEVGVVGAKLLYADDTVQHAGVVIGFGGYAGHVNNGIDKDEYGFMCRAQINCDYSAVTGACMLVDKKCFDEVNGFDESFKVACNDVDLCLKIRELDKLVVFNAFALWHHYESKSRGYEDNIEKQMRFDAEVGMFQEKWEKLLSQGDPYYNPNFNMRGAPFTL